MSAIGNVAFPKLAAQQAVTSESHKWQWIALATSVALALSVVVPLASVAYWVIPLVFGKAYLGAVPLLWILSPGAVFLAAGQVASDLLRGRRRPMVIGRAHGIAAIFTVVLLPPYCPSLGCMPLQSHRLRHMLSLSLY